MHACMSLVWSDPVGSDAENCQLECEAYVNMTNVTQKSRIYISLCEMNHIAPTFIQCYMHGHLYLFL